MCFLGIHTQLKACVNTEKIHLTQALFYGTCIYMYTTQ